MWSPFLSRNWRKMSELLFWRFQIKWIYIVILQTFSYLQYFYTQINNNQMQGDLFKHMFEEFIKWFRPFKRAVMMLMWPTVKMGLTPLLLPIASNLSLLSSPFASSIWRLSPGYKYTYYLISFPFLFLLLSGRMRPGYIGKLLSVLFLFLIAHNEDFLLSPIRPSSYILSAPLVKPPW